MTRVGFASILLLGSIGLQAQQSAYDLLVKGGHVIDPKNYISRVMDVAVSGGKIARVADNIPASQAKTVADVAGLYVTPGLIDIHVHVYNATPVTSTAARSNSVWPDAFSFRTGVTTMVDAGTSGSANFDDFKEYVIKKSKTRVLAFVNISKQGMTAFGNEDNLDDLDPEGVVKIAKANPDVVVGVKSAHYGGAGWASIDRAVEASRKTNLPVMVDFGIITPERNLDGLLRDKLRKGDIYTHCFSGNRREVVENKLIQ
jgi:dihydroorotase